jgi:cytochrome c-type biogenesis protein CcmH
MRPWIPLLLLVFASLMPATLPASQPALPNADDPVLEARLNALAADLRCVVCQNETLAESRASLALDLREEIREMMRAGLSDAAVVESLVDRYGDFVLYRPPLKPLTYALWGGPAVFLLIGLALAAAALYRRRAIPVADDISPEALAQAARLLQDPQSIPPGSATEPSRPSPPQDTR